MFEQQLTLSLRMLCTFHNSEKCIVSQIENRASWRKQRETETTQCCHQGAAASGEVASRGRQTAAEGQEQSHPGRPPLPGARGGARGDARVPDPRACPRQMKWDGR